MVRVSKSELVCPKKGVCAKNVSLSINSGHLKSANRRLLQKSTQRRASLKRVQINKRMKEKILGLTNFTCCSRFSTKLHGGDAVVWGTGYPACSILAPEMTTFSEKAWELIIVVWMHHCRQTQKVSYRPYLGHATLQTKGDPVGTKKEETNVNLTVKKEPTKKLST